MYREKMKGYQELLTKKAFGNQRLIYENYVPCIRVNLHPGNFRKDPSFFPPTSPQCTFRYSIYFYYKYETVFVKPQLAYKYISKNLSDIIKFYN